MLWELKIIEDKIEEKEKQKKSARVENQGNF